MRLRDTSQTVSPMEQMYFLNRSQGLRGMGDALSTAAAADPEPYSKAVLTTVSIFKRIAGLFHIGGDAYKDIHIPQQNAAVAGFQKVLDVVQQRLQSQTLTQADLNIAAQAITAIYQQFNAYTNQLANQHPSDASRYRAGASEVQALGQSLINGMAGSPAGQFVAAHPQSGFSSVLSSVTSAFTNPGGGISTTGMAVLAAGFFFLPNLLKGLKRG